MARPIQSRDRESYVRSILDLSRLRASVLQDPLIGFELSREIETLINTLIDLLYLLAQQAD